MDKSDHSLTYAVLGTGGLGGYFGGRLARAGHPVHFQVRTGCDEVRRLGLRVASCNGDFQIEKVSAWPDTASGMPRADVVLVCLKTTANHLLPAMLRPILKEDSLVVLVQNGLLFEERLQAQLPGVMIAGCTSYICAWKTAPGQIVHAELGSLSLAPLGTSPELWRRLERVAADFEAAGVPARLEPDLRKLRWEKLVWNVPYNGLTVALGATTAEINADPAARSLARDLMREVQAGAAACGATIPDEYLERNLSLTDGMLPYSPSMKLDYDEGRPMEIEGLYSNPLAAALEKGRTLPLMGMLERQLRFLEARKLKPTS